MNGGYLMVSKTDTDLYAKLVKGLTIGKPILWYESPTECYYIDTISGGEVTSEIIDDEEVFTYGDIILTKGGKTITIEADGDITESGDIQTHLYKYYSDYSEITSDGEDYYITFIDFSNEDLQEYIDILNNNSETLENKYNALYEFVSKLKQLNFVGGVDSGYSGTLYIDNNTLYIGYDGNNPSITLDTLTLLNCKISKYQLI